MRPQEGVFFQNSMDSDSDEMVNELDERAPLMTGLCNFGQKHHENLKRESVQTYVPPRLDYDLVSSLQYPARCARGNILSSCCYFAQVLLFAHHTSISGYV